MDEDSSSVTLPKHFGLKSKQNGEYLRHVPELNKVHGYLQFSGKTVVSPYSKFDVEKSLTGEGLVHIRCCYNNKYWVLSESNYIVAAAKKPEEDRSKSTCTLFKPSFDADLNAFSFLHVQLGQRVQLDDSDGDFKSCLIPHTSGAQDSYFFTLINWDSLFVLPNYVAFKGNNGCYLKPILLGHSRQPYLKFYGSNITEPGVKNKIITTPDGHVRIKNEPSGKFWRRDPNWIVLGGDKSESSVNDPNTLFWPVRVGHNVVALRNKANNCFCIRLSVDSKNDMLNADDGDISETAKMEVTEVLVNREIYNVRFRLSDSIIYNERPLIVTSGLDENKNLGDDKLSVKLSYEDTATSTWNSTVSNKLTASLSFESKIPLIGNAEMDMSAEESNEYEWGNTKQTKSLVEVGYEIVVPSSTAVHTKIIATQGTRDIPFSYTQRDTLTNGKVITRRYDDGLYTGINCYNYQFLTEDVEE